MSTETPVAEEGISDDVADRMERIRRSRFVAWVKRAVALVTLVLVIWYARRSVGFDLRELVRYLPEFEQALGQYFPTTTVFGLPVLDVGQYWQFAVAENLVNPLWVLGIAVPIPGDAVMVTVSMAALGTLLGLPGALLLGTLGSERITPFPFNFVFRTTMSVIRAIPALVWALIYIPLGGVSPFTATLAIATDTMGYLGRLFTDELEEIEEGPIDGIESTGADTRQTVYFGMLSQVVRQYIAWTMYVFELNVRIAITLGLIGAGGLGYVLMIQRKTFQYTNMMAAILVSVVVLLSIEMASQRIRSNLRREESETEGWFQILKEMPRKMAESLAK